MHDKTSFCSPIVRQPPVTYLDVAGTETVKQMLGMLSMLRPLLAGVAATFRRLSLQLLHLHKGVAKLGYIVTSLLSGVMQEGYCTASETEDTEAGVLPPGIPSINSFLCLTEKTKGNRVYNQQGTWAQVYGLPFCHEMCADLDVKALGTS